GGSLDGDDEIALIFVGDKTLRHMAEDQESEAESEDEENESDGFKAEKHTQAVHIGVGDDLEDAVNPEGEPIFGAVDAAEQQGCERGRQGESVEGGDGDGERDGQRKLAEEDAGGTGEKCDRDKDGDENERGSDDGAGDFLHGVNGGFGCAGLALLQVALDV